MSPQNLPVLAPFGRSRPHDNPPPPTPQPPPPSHKEDKTIGADLYIQSLIEPNKKKYGPKIDEVVRMRNAARTERERNRYQGKILDYYDKIYSEGYFRDSYNDGNLLWHLKLDYWKWFASYLDAEGLLHPDKAELVLSEVEQRKYLLDEITDKEERDHFHERYHEFVTFLRTAIERDEPIMCSI